MPLGLNNHLSDIANVKQKSEKRILPSDLSNKLQQNCVFIDTSVCKRWEILDWSVQTKAKKNKNSSTSKWISFTFWEEIQHVGNILPVLYTAWVFKTGKPYIQKYITFLFCNNTVGVSVTHKSFSIFTQ